MFNKKKALKFPSPEGGLHKPDYIYHSHNPRLSSPDISANI